MRLPSMYITAAQNTFYLKCLPFQDSSSNVKHNSDRGKTCYIFPSCFFFIALNLHPMSA